MFAVILLDVEAAAETEHLPDLENVLIAFQSQAICVQTRNPLNHFFLEETFLF